MPAAGGATTQLLPRLLFLPFFFLFHPISLSTNFIQNTPHEEKGEGEGKGKEKGKEEGCFLANRQKQVQAGLSEHFDPKWSLVRLYAWFQLKDTNASPDKTWVCLWEDIGLWPRLKLKVYTTALKILKKITNAHIQLCFHRWVHKDQTGDSAHTYPSGLCQNCLSLGTHGIRLQPIKSVSYDRLLAGMPLCQSPESTKVPIWRKKKSKPRSVFVGLACNSRIYWQRRRHQRKMHFQPCPLF